MTARNTVLITGCSAGGIGHALAQSYHATGFRVFATSRSLDSMKELDAAGIETFALDVTNSSDIQRVKKQVSQLTGGKLNILINNAGIAYHYSIADLSMQNVRELYNVNLFGAIEITHEFIPLLLAAADSHACVVNMASTAALMPIPFNSVYNSAKAALVSFSDTLRVELAPFNVKVICSITGNFQTNLMKPASLPENSIYDPMRVEYQRYRIDRFQEAAIPVENFVKTLVKESAKARPKTWLWSGGNSLKVWLIWMFLPRLAFDKILSDMFGISKLTQLLHLSQAKSGA